MWVQDYYDVCGKLKIPIRSIICKRIEKGKRLGISIYY